jgi:hypothetical protein
MSVRDTVEIHLTAIYRVESGERPPYVAVAFLGQAVRK